MKFYTVPAFFLLSAAIVGCGGSSASDGVVDSGDLTDIDVGGPVDSRDVAGIDAATSRDGADGSRLDTGTAAFDQASADVPIDAATCPAVDSSCGGDLVGTWHMVSMCSTPSVPRGACPQMELSTDRSKSDTAYTFSADGSFAYITSGMVVDTVRYPLDCLGNGAQVGIVRACADLEAGLQSQNDTTAACAVDENQLCVCKISRTFSRVESGTYVLEGASIRFKVTALSDLDGGAVDAGTYFTGLELPTTYCVSGETLVLWVAGLTGARTWTTFHR